MRRAGVQARYGTALVVVPGPARSEAWMLTCVSMTGGEPAAIAGRTGYFAAGR
ncbi:MAG TPA: hypothetical protein VH023_15940 [Rhodopila sp.]|nr:hypothetical protein [Rhodopila sp.]